MTTNGFAQPDSTGDGIKWANHIGALLLIEPKMVHPDVTTIHGTTDAVEADIAVIDGPGSVATFNGVYIFAGGLVRATRNHIGERIVGRLIQGQAKEGKNPPWKLAEYTDADIEKAAAYLAKDLRRPTTPVPAGHQAFGDDPPPF